MSTNQTWHGIEKLIGWHVTDAFDAKRKAAFLKRHSPHPYYIPISKIPKLTEAESASYAKRHMDLHSELQDVTQAHFRDTPIPKKAKWQDSPGWAFTAFTRQFLDWWKDTYQVEITVVKNYISANLLQQLQSLLIRGFPDWCIYLRGSDSFDFDPKYDLLVFSDEVLLPIATAKALKIPKDLWS